MRGVSPPKRTQPNDVREALLRTATRLIAARGFGAISVQDIADEIGVTKQALLYHFKSKDALKTAVVQALLTRTNERFIEMLGSLTAEEAGRVDALLRHIQRYLAEEPYTAPVLLRFLLDRDEGAVEEIKKGVAPWLRFIEQELRRGQKSGLLRPELEAEEALMQIGMLVATNFAVLPLGDWSKKTGAGFRKKRLEQLLKAVSYILFTDEQREGAKRKQR